MKILKIDEVYGLRVFTEDGEYFGEVEDVVLGMNKVKSWRIKATKGSYLSKVLGGAKGIVVPQKVVKAINDVMIVLKNAVPNERDIKDATDIESQGDLN